MATTPDDSAPLPWLGEPGDGIAAQAWSLSDNNEAFLTLHYTPTPSGFLRTTSHLLWRRLPALVMGSISLSLMTTCVVIIFILFLRANTASPLQPQVLAHFFLLFFGGMAAFFFAIAGLMLALVIPFGSTFVAGMVKPITLRLTREGIRREIGGSVAILRWVNLARIEERRGDLYFLGTIANGFDHAILCPTLPEPDSMRRFHANALALWKSNGGGMPTDPTAKP